MKNRGPNQIADNVSISKAKELEANFFAETEPYKSMVDYKERFGTHNLVEKLKIQLFKLIKKNIPYIVNNLQD